MATTEIMRDQLVVELDPDLRAIVQTEIDAGEAVVPGDVMRMALELLASERSYAGEKGAILGELLDTGLADLDAGRVSDRSAREIFADVLARRKA